MDDTLNEDVALLPILKTCKYISKDSTIVMVLMLIIHKMSLI